MLPRVSHSVWDAEEENLGFDQDLLQGNRIRE